jgi:peptidyl-prolyl cis-trans isomerase C
MASKKHFVPFILVWVILASLVLAACRGSTTATPPGTAPEKAPVVEVPGKSSPAAATAPVLVDPTSVPTLTSTPEPLALRVNEEGVTVLEYQAELAQLQEALAALGQELAPEEQRQKVLDNLVNTTLLAQGAFRSGYSLEDAALQAELARLTAQMGGDSALGDWLARYGYSESGFQAALRRALAAAWQRDQIAAAIPEQVEQVHARQILTLDEATAVKVHQQVLVPGVNFDNYAFRYDLQTGGDLGWFPRGYLLQPEVEAAAFALEPGQISEVVQSAIGFHVVQVGAREQRLLSPDARRFLQHKALEKWLEEQRSQSQIEFLAGE